MLSCLRPALRRLAILLSWLAAALWLAAPALANDLVSERAVWEDPTGQATPGQARQAAYTPMVREVLSRGFTNSALWLRLRVDGVPAGAGDTSLVLRIRPGFLDEVELFDPLAPPGGPQVAGDRQPRPPGGFASVSHTFTIPASQAPRDLYLRLRTTSSSLMHVQVMTLRDFHLADTRQDRLYGVHLSLMVLMYLWVFASWLRERDPIGRAFLVKQALCIAYTFCFFGYHRLLLDGVLPPAALDWFFSLMVVSVLPAGTWFEYRFLHQYRLPRPVSLGLLALLAWGLANVALMLGGQVQPALQSVNLLVATASAFLAVAAWWVQPRLGDDDPAARVQLPKAWVVASYMLLAMVLATTVASHAGWVDDPEVTLHAFVMYSLVSGLVMSVLVQLRMHRVHAQHQRVARELALVARQAELERAQKEEHKQFLHMLMHEIRNPLAVIDMTLNLQQDDPQAPRPPSPASRAVADIQAIIERCVELDHLDASRPVRRAKPVALGELVHELRERLPHVGGAQDLQVRGEARIHTDPHFLRVILGNLLDNALRYGDAQAPVGVEIEQRPGPDGKPGVRVSVTNRPGLAARPDPHRVFLKYYRSPGAMKQSGTGLGLFLVARLAQRLGGRCELRPDDQHVRFDLWLPA